MEQPLKDYPFHAVLSFEPLIQRLNQINDDSRAARLCQMENLLQMLSQAPELNGPIADLSLLERHRDLVQSLMSFIFPPLYWEREAFAAIIPFSMEPIFVSPQFQRLFLDKDGSFHGRLNLDDETFNRGRIIRAYLFILKKFYDIDQNLDYPVIRTVPGRIFVRRKSFSIIGPPNMLEPSSISCWSSS